MTRETIATNLRAARINRGLSCGQVALRAGMTKDTVRRYEIGRLAPGSINLAILCRLYRVSADSILGIE
jgi:transcriptional regulator with XRE-family HTH domain